MFKPEARAGYEAHAAIALVSGEHRFLRGQLENLPADLEAGGDLAVVIGHARKFVAHTINHFLHEEWAMRASSFPDLTSHDSGHRRFISEADDMLRKLHSSASRRQEGRTLTETFLRWMEHHQAHDSHFIEYCHQLVNARELMFDPTQEFSLESPEKFGERRLAAVLCADVAGFARLVGENEAQTIADWCSCWHEIVRPAVISHSGRIVKSTGDGFIAEFASARDAVDCALAIQIAANPDGGTTSLFRRLMLRIGIHLCYVMPYGTDIFGHGVNIAARLQSEAPPGSVCISESGRRAIGSPEGMNFIDFGFRQLRNIEEPFRIYLVEPQICAD
jgi:class 3 adenylate cyclase